MFEYVVARLTRSHVSQRYSSSGLLALSYRVAGVSDCMLPTRLVVIFTNTSASPQVRSSTSHATRASHVLGNML